MTVENDKNMLTSDTTVLLGFLKEMIFFIFDMWRSADIPIVIMVWVRDWNIIMNISITITMINYYILENNILRPTIISS